MEKIKWSGATSAYAHKFNPQAELPADTPAGVRKVWLLDAQWSTCPIEVEDQVKLLWNWYENGNDSYIIKTSIRALKKLHKSVNTNAVVQYLEEMGVTDEDEDVIIHWWW